MIVFDIKFSIYVINVAPGKQHGGNAFYFNRKSCERRSDFDDKYSLISGP